MKWLLIVFLHVLGVALLVFVGLQLNDTLDRYAGVSSVLSGAFGIHTLAFSLLYNRSPKFYSAVNRLLLLVQRDHTYWLINIDFEIEPAGHDEKAALIDEIIARLRSGGLGRVCVRLQTANRLEFTIDDLIGLVIGLDGAGLHVSLDRKLTVPVHAYGEYQRRLLAITEAIQSVVRPTQVRCSVQVSFRGGEEESVLRPLRRTHPGAAVGGLPRCLPHRPNVRLPGGGQPGSRRRGGEQPGRPVRGTDLGAQLPGSARREGFGMKPYQFYMVKAFPLLVQGRPVRNDVRD